MMWPPRINIVLQLPVATLDPRNKGNRESRRRNRHGKQNVWDGLNGVLSPKQMRESGL